MSSIQSVIRAAIADSPLAASEDQWLTTWQAVASFCGNQMANKRGVTIPGFAIFAFNPGPKQLGAQHLRPVLWFHQQWASLHHIRPGPASEARPRGPVAAPVINWVSISQGTGLSKHILTSIFKELTIAIGTAAQHGEVLLDFGFCRCRVGNGRYSYAFADQLLAVEVPDARPTVMRSLSPQGAARGAVAPGSLSRSHPGPIYAGPAGSVPQGAERRGTGGSGGSSLPALVSSPNGRFPHTYDGSGSASPDDDDGADADGEDVGQLRIGKRVTVGGAVGAGGTAASPGSPGGAVNPAVERAKRKRVLKKLHRIGRAQEYYDSWGGQVAAKDDQKKADQMADKRDLEVMARWAQEDESRAKDRDHLRKQQASHVQTMNAQLAVDRAARAKPRGEAMGDVFAGREEPKVEPPDFEFLKRQIAEKKEREKAFDRLNDVDVKPFDFAGERQRQTDAKRAAAMDLRSSYAQQIAFRKARGPQLTQAGDEELNFFFRNQTPEEMKHAEAIERQRDREKARGVLERNLRDTEEKEKVRRMQAAEDARRERALHDATKTLEDDRVVREEVERQRQKLSMVASWQTATSRKDAEKARQKELFQGWTDQLPYRNDSSDSDLDISELADRMRAAERRRKDAERRWKEDATPA